MNNITWKSFVLSDVFNITSSNDGIDKNKLSNRNLEGKIPYITRTDKNNGIDMFITPQNYEINKGNVIIIGLDTQTVFYQESDFYTGQNIQILSNKFLNKDNSIFLINLLKILLKKFTWGGNGATLTRLRNSRIYLPITNQELPDYKYMENFSKSLKRNKIKKYKLYCENKLKNIEYKEIPSLDSLNWKEFYINEIFNKIQRGKRLTKKNFKYGKTPYVSSSAINNGIDNFIGNDKNVRIFENCLSIANSGSVGSTFYHNYPFIASDHITHLKNEKLNKYMYLFIATILKRLNEKYSFNREINDSRIKNEKILLPITKDELPDYKYMEQYMKNCIYQKYNKYLDYINKKYAFDI